MSALRARLLTAGYVAAWKVVGVLPATLTAALFRCGADLAWRRGGRGVQQLRRNLSRVVSAAPPGAGVRTQSTASHRQAEQALQGPTLGSSALESSAIESSALESSALESVVRAALRSYARYWLETFRLPRMGTADVISRVHTEGEQHLDAAVAAGKGVILALPHSGNWDVAGLWLVDRGLSFTTVAERLRPESLFDRFVAYRESLGMEILPLHGGERPLMAELAERLRSGGCVCLVADRDLSESGVSVEFFGESARMPPGPVLLAATSGAALLPVTVYYTAEGWGQWIGAPIELGTGRLRERVQRGTQTLAGHFAQRIAAHPADWHMLQTIWPADELARRSAPAAAAR